MKILYFTATGNSLYIAKSFGGELYSIPRMEKEEIYDFTDEKIGIIFPLHAWSVPPHVEQFLKKARFNCRYLFAVITYGVYSAGVISHLLDIAKEAGYEFSYISKIKMVDNYLPGFDMEKQVKNESKKQIERNLEVINSDIQVEKVSIPKDTVLNRMATKQMLKGGGKHANKPSNKTSVKVHSVGEGMENYYYVDDGCTKCGVCAKVCPIDNIETNDNKKIELKGNCMMCFACIQNCPSRALHIRGEVSGNRYRHKNIKLSEIIEANN